MGSSLTGDADWPNLASVAHYGISLMDTALRATLEPVTVLESSDPTLVWLQAVGTVLAGLAAVISAVIAWWSHRFAQEALERQRALEHFYKTQEAASNMLTAGVDAIDKALLRYRSDTLEVVLTQAVFMLHQTTPSYP